MLKERYYCSILLLAYLFLCSPWANAASQPPVPVYIPPITIQKQFQILEAGTLAEPKVMHAGAAYILKVNTAGMTAIQNRIVLYFGQTNTADQSYRIVEFYIDKAQGDGASIAVDPSKNLQWNFLLPDTNLLYDHGFLRLFALHTAPGSNIWHYTQDYFEMDNPTTEYAMALNNGAPALVLQATVGYVGDLKSDDEIAAMIADMKQRFHFASKGYVDIAPVYAGRSVFPADGAMAGNPAILHDYSAWWSGLPHNLAGSGYLPLDPNKPEDLRMIRLAWYQAHYVNSATLDPCRNDIEAMIPGSQNITLSESGGGMSNAYNAAAIIGLYNFYTFKVSANGAMQYGLPPTLDWLPSKQQQNIALHEYGHVLGLTHAGVAGADFQSNPSMIDYRTPLSGFAEIMTQGVEQGHELALFYSDKDIGVISKFTVQNQPSLPIPAVRPLGDPAPALDTVLTGEKQAGAGLLANGSVLIAVGDMGTSFSIPVSLVLGENRFDVAQRIVVGGVARDSHPNIVYTTFAPLPALPEAPTIAFTTVPIAVYGLGDNIQFALSAQAAAGIDKLDWWVEKWAPTGMSIFNTGYQYRVISNMNYTRSLFGAARAKHSYSIALEDSGYYRLRARIYDGKGAASSILVAAFKVGNP
ncbi:MAG: hypothetical protein V4582_19385 [Pseudomonadota bacterium]